MLTYPQLSTGALVQFPVGKRRLKRTVVNELADHSTVKFSDPGVEVVEWHLEYAGLSDEEITALEGFFAATEGSLTSFTFLDPCGNLFGWSDDLRNVAWIKAPFLTMADGADDPFVGKNAWSVNNTGLGTQRLSQNLAVPGSYVYTLSLYVRSQQSVKLSLVLGNTSSERQTTADWRRISLSGNGIGAASEEFGIELPAGASVDVFGLQLEPQAGASVYKPSRLAGVYENAYFKDDVLAITSTGVNRHSATVDIIHAKRL